MIRKIYKQGSAIKIPYNVFAGGFFACLVVISILFCEIGRLQSVVQNVQQAQASAYEDAQLVSEKQVSEIRNLQDKVLDLERNEAKKDETIKGQKKIIDAYDQALENYECEVTMESITVLETKAQFDSQWAGPKLNVQKGVNNGPSGRETFYNLNMAGCVKTMRKRGYSAKKYPVWIRSDGVKMFGDYVMIAANWKTRPLGTKVETSLGLGIVVDTGEFVKKYPNGIDIAVNWTT